MTTRPLTSDEFAHIETTLQQLRDHFRVWPTEPGNEWHLVDFVFYEGCGGGGGSGQVLELAGPLALGNHLVQHYGCDWRMIASAEGWRYAINHPRLSSPIDLYWLDRHPMRDADEHDEDTEPFCPGEGAHESFYAIKRILEQDVG